MSLRGGVVQWVARLTRNVEALGSSPIKGPDVSLSKKLYPHWLVPGTDSRVIITIELI